MKATCERKSDARKDALVCGRESTGLARVHKEGSAAKITQAFSGLVEDAALMLHEMM
jgi:hypothetical protein